MSKVGILKSLVFVAAGVILGLIVPRLVKLDSGHENARDSGAQLSLTIGQESAASSSVADWCLEHRVPESECTACNPILIESFKQNGDWCGEHSLPESHCRICNPSLAFEQEPVEPITAEPIQTSVFFPPNEVGCQTEKAVIRFATAQTADRIGLKVEPVGGGAKSAAIEAPAEIVLDETRTMALTTPAAATVIKWLVEPGDQVDALQPLAELESPEVSVLKGEYLEAAADYKVDSLQLHRTKELFQRDMTSQSELEQIEAEVNAAQSRVESLAGRLRATGFSQDDLAQLASEKNLGSRWFLRSSMAATLMERRAPLGEMMPSGSTLAIVGEPDELWIESHVREQDLSSFHTGQKIEFTLDGEALTRASGQVIWVSQYLDPLTRTGLVRAKVANAQNGLRANMFGRIQLRSETVSTGYLVSKDAVQWEGCCFVAFVQEAEDRYRPRKITIDRGDPGHYLVMSGLNEGDLVVTSGSFLLKSELMKESLGAGCAGE